ncbi:hypothetical protein T01_4149 [Trichinella spiralis]|uniref:Uncharacterized protein n=1 Tax=Trichinella spiralis TaxID=6334 RepID=A0A0V1BS70_TRISP|nr:hypothetical protein T01_4149 [Trichinella spiralis]
MQGICWYNRVLTNVLQYEYGIRYSEAAKCANYATQSLKQTACGFEWLNVLSAECHRHSSPSNYHKVALLTCKHGCLSSLDYDFAAQETLNSMSSSCSEVNSSSKH